jgi:hypothetical protein
MEGFWSVRSFKEPFQWKHLVQIFLTYLFFILPDFYEFVTFSSKDTIMSIILFPSSFISVQIPVLLRMNYSI